MDNFMQGRQSHSPMHASIPPQGSAGMPGTRQAASAAPRPQHEEELQRWTFTWMATLPAHLRPIRLGKRFARIANRLAAVWNDEKTTSRYMDSLLLDTRGGRQGFPKSVAGELRQLDSYHKSRRQNDESLWDYV